MSKSSTVNLTGQIFGSWHVLSFVSDVSIKHSMWLCKCCCGKVRQVKQDSLTIGASTSCGHQNRARFVESVTIHGHSPSDKSSLTYQSHEAMIARCTNPNHAAYPKYGGRGITVCDRWLIFANFLEDMGERPTVEHSIDRYPNGEGPYEPDNARWATRQEQINNRKITKFTVYNGERISYADLARKLDIPYNQVVRLSRGWTINEMLKSPRYTNRNAAMYKFDGQELTVSQWSKKTGICVQTLNYRIMAQKWPIDKALTTPPDASHTQKDIEIKGEHKCLSEWCKVYKINYGTVLDRINHRGWETVRAITTPSRNRKTK